MTVQVEKEIKSLTNEEHTALVEIAKLHDQYFDKVLEGIRNGASFNTVGGRLTFEMLSDYVWDVNYDVVDVPAEVKELWGSCKAYFANLINSVKYARNALINSYFTYCEYISDFDSLNQNSEDDLDSIGDVSRDYYALYGGILVDDFKDNDLTILSMHQRQELNELLKDAGFMPLFINDQIIYTADVELDYYSKQIIEKMTQIKNCLN